MEVSTWIEGKRAVTIAGSRTLGWTIADRIRQTVGIVVAVYIGGEHARSNRRAVFVCIQAAINRRGSIVDSSDRDGHCAGVARRTMGICRADIKTDHASFQSGQILEVGAGVKGKRPVAVAGGRAFGGAVGDRIGQAVGIVVGVDVRSEHAGSNRRSVFVRIQAAVNRHGRVIDRSGDDGGSVVGDSGRRTIIHRNGEGRRNSAGGGDLIFGGSKGECLDRRLGSGRIGGANDVDSRANSGLGKAATGQRAISSNVQCYDEI